MIPAGCLHYPDGELDLLKEWVKAVKGTPNSFGILMGDTFDFARTHYRDHITSYRADKNSQERIDSWARRDIEALAKIISPIKKRLIGAILGNHFHAFLDGTNSEQYLCRLLEIPYLGPIALVRLEFRDKGGEGRLRHTMMLWGHHTGGSSGGRTTGADVGSLERTEGSFDADIYLLGHTHKRHVIKKPILTMSSKGKPHILARMKVFARTGAFLKGYSEDYPSTTMQHVPTYAEEKAYRPTDLGWVEITIKLTESGGNAGQPKEIRQAVSVRF